MISYKKQKGFSLIEVSMTLLVLSLVLVLMAPFMTKKFRNFGTNGVVFEYSENFKQKSNGDTVDNNNYCFITNQAGNYVATKDCSEYEFTVPKGVDKINLTLVAGGGGGGGASGMMYWKNTNFLSKRSVDFDSATGADSNHWMYGGSTPSLISNNHLIPTKNIKDFIINFITTTGQPSKLPGCGVHSMDKDGTTYIDPNKLCNHSSTGDYAYSWQKHLFNIPTTVGNAINKAGVTGKSNTYTADTGEGGASSPALYNYRFPRYTYRYDSFYDILDGTVGDDYLYIYIHSSAYSNSSNKIYGLTKGIGTLNEDNTCVNDKYKINDNTDLLYKQNGICVKRDNTIAHGGKSELRTYIEMGTNRYGFYIYRLGSGEGNNSGISLITNSNERPLPNISDTNIMLSKQGLKGGSFTFFGTSDSDLRIGENANQSITYLGGKGGTLDIEDIGDCGAGGQGYGFAYDKTATGTNKNRYMPSLQGGPACISTTTTYIPPTPNEASANQSSVTGLRQKPGGMGGAGGSAVRIIDFAVTPGETYIIRVGKGGAGGYSGLDGYKTLKNNVETGTTQAPTDGGNGTGGTSTSIWKKNSDGTQTLIYLVTGGNGGYGGQYQGVGTGRYNKKTYHRLVSSNANFITNAQFDSNIAQKVTDSGSITLVGTTYNTAAISEKYMSIRPYKFLNFRAVSYAERCSNGGDTAGTNTCSGAYNYFNKTDDNSQANFINSMKPDGQTSLNAYDGLFYKTFSKNGGAAYIGGLGGFSGLGTKAGCGGMFMGNSRGLVKNGSTYGTNDLMLHKIITPVDGNLGEVHYFYNVLEYYDNCNLDTPNGQSAKFVSPQISSARGIDYGQAGAGGGGGGYFIDKGAGKGGDGQNGYLIIDWRK